MVEAQVEILLVEDNPNDVELTLHALRESHVTNPVHVVRDGAEALEFIFCTGAYASRNMNNTPKVILLDLKLPKVDGLEVLRQMKTDKALGLIPVVMLTTSDRPAEVEEAYRLGANSYITKPVRFTEFLQKVETVELYWLLTNTLPDK